MAYRSWLKDVQSIHDLGAHCYVYRDGPDSELREIKYEAKAMERFRMDIPVDEAYKSYFGSRMHDSWVQAITRTAGELRVQLSTINADIFAIGLADVLEIPWPRHVWPVDLIFEDAVYVNAVRADRRGHLRWTDWQHFERPADPCSGQSFLYDWFFEQDGRIQWIAEIWGWRRVRHRLDDSLYLLVDCARARAEDRQRAALVKAFSESAGLLWDDAINGIDVGDEPYGPWGAADMGAFLRRRMAARGIAVADLMPSTTHATVPS